MTTPSAAFLASLTPAQRAMVEQIEATRPIPLTMSIKQWARTHQCVDLAVVSTRRDEKGVMEVLSIKSFAEYESSFQAK